MTVPVDDYPLHQVGFAGVTGATSEPYVHRPTRVSVRSQSPGPDFCVVIEPATGHLQVVGEFDLACGDLFRDASAVTLAGDATEAVVDFAHLGFIDTHGVEMLIEFGRSLAVRGATLRIVNADARIGRVFAICGLSAMLTAGTAPSRDEVST